MKFTIHYETRWGENLVLRVGEKAYPMNYISDGLWEVELPAKALREGDEYYYEVMEGGLHTRHEWHTHRLAQKPSKNLVINDQWSDVTGWRGAGRRPRRSAGSWTGPSGAKSSRPCPMV